jgi:hypothetical protein
MLDEAVLTVASTDEYRRSLADLLRNGELRRRAGMAAGTAVRETHGQAQWKARLAALYEWALATPPLLKRSEPSGFPPENLDAYAAALLGIEAATPLLWSLLLITENLDRRDRLQLLARTTVLRARHRLRTQSPGPGGVDGPWLLPRWTSETS